MELLTYIGYLLVFAFVICLPGVILDCIWALIKYIFGIGHKPGQYRRSIYSNNSSDNTQPFYREQFVRPMGEAGHLYTYTDTAYGTVVNKYGAPPEEAVVITHFNK
jgi:hypothetical protein